MILYLDASALVKRYVAEAGSAQVGQAIASADLVGTALISRAEVAAALAKAVRVGALKPKDALASLQAFRREWLDFVRMQITEGVISRADALAWEHHLRGYDAVQLAAASLWQETLGEMVTMATFDQPLWTAAEKIGLSTFPEDLPMLLKNWKDANKGKG
jgi:predicted nucleic acid-binding protein